MVLEGYVSLDGDCDDNDPNLNSFDEDGDGLGTCEGDCDDSSPLINPNASGNLQWNR